MGSGNHGQSLARALPEMKEKKCTTSKKIISGWLKPLVSRGVIPILEADKGYNSKELRLQILNLKIFPYIPYRQMGKTKSDPSRKVLENHRWKVERGIAWLKRKYRVGSLLG
jgi:hypothetical protein